MENNRIDLCAPEGETPIYDQIRQELAGRIRAGSLPDGTRLPTVRELSEQLHVAEGTVKRAYDELERDGLLIKTPGRGSFVCYHRTADRRQAAQEQIDALLQQLHQMGISVHEMKQLFADQLRRFCAQQPKLQVALVECNPEVLAQLKEQLRHMDGIELHTLLLEQVQQHPGRLAQQMDVMITTTEHAKQLAGMTGQAEKVAKIALRLTPQSIAAIVKLTPGAHVGILTHSLRFGALLQEHCRSYALGAVLDEPALLQPGAAFEAYLRGKSVILVPEGYENDCTPEVLGALRRFARRGSVVPCAYRIDEGSRIYLTERLERLRSGLTAERAAWA